MTKTKKHGTHSTYGHGCRCTPCREAHREYERNAARRRRRIAYGFEVPVVKLVDSTEPRNHIIFLASQGIGLGAIANQVGTYRSTIQRIKRGKTQKTSAELASKILAVPAIPREPMAFTSAEPIKKLLKDLDKKGISNKDVGRIVGARYGNLRIKTHMRVWRYQQLEAVCKELLRKNP